MDNYITLLGHWFYSGKMRKAPGTWGTLAALPFAYLIHAYLGEDALLLCAVICSVVGVSVSDRYMEIHQLSHDPSEIVIDEVAGMWLVIALMPQSLSLSAYVLAFVLFRLFDIAKPWPISVADKKIQGGLGVMLDDTLAAFMALIVLWAISYV